MVELGEKAIDATAVPLSDLVAAALAFGAPSLARQMQPQRGQHDVLFLGSVVRTILSAEGKTCTTETSGGIKAFTI
ncbi:hypothetical protein CU103_30530 [Phyllobacterium sophorae]|uniref:Uncharacterized protein n=1 Tax=Phyllobacterium sophorae TaxID=1520277 RepID=A0A2P7AN04_9HYPH|nr:hypothetical protein CU103_30530 [Phyllobacterium sophorae]